MRLLGWLAALVLGAVAMAEILLQPPTSGERWQLIAILVTPAVAAAALVPLLGRWVSSRASVAGAALVVGFCSLALGAVTTSAASNAMFLSSHDYRLFIVVLALSCGIALVVGMQLTRPLARDIARLGTVATQVAGGDLTVRTGITRADEVGRTAVAIDEMVSTLDHAAHERAREARARELLFGGISHDLRTPLAAVLAAVETLQDGLTDDTDHFLAIIGKEVRNIEALLDHLTEYARIEAGAPSGVAERVSITEAAHEAVEALAPSDDRRDVRLVLDADGPAFVLAPWLDVTRSLRNPLENAIAHCPAGGRVVVAVRCGGDGVEVQIRDDGAGFPSEFRAVAFDAFTRADTARASGSGHAGLGLAITRALVEQNGGRVWLGDATGGDVRLWMPTKETS